ncbi:zinc-ribbon domain-containing protein [uncultured Anaerococcus sp.]|uniref:zinc-ribbon domain-containing protein n=1 Tax=uncultured Anaerococcus sp. TaxID=293428 RepID=UPI0028896393|nr:zinc-ribbon domain-containing protein [uncultured Anaerococcus sp.]
MFCKNCGAEIKQGANFCTQCGSPIDKEKIRRENPLLNLDLDEKKEELAEKFEDFRDDFEDKLEEVGEKIEDSTEEFRQKAKDKAYEASDRLEDIVDDIRDDYQADKDFFAGSKDEVRQPIDYLEDEERVNPANFAGQNVNTSQHEASIELKPSGLVKAVSLFGMGATAVGAIIFVVDLIRLLVFAIGGIF